MGFDRMKATRELGALLKGREDGSLEWRESGESHWLVGTFIMVNDAKFEVRLRSGKYEGNRLYFNHREGQPTKPLGTFDSREAVEAAIRQSLSETDGDGPWALHYEEK